MDILKALQLESTNSGTSTGSNWWSKTTNPGEIVSYNPTDGKAIGSVYNCSEEDYEHVMAEANKAYLSWRMVPAPKRGEIDPFDRRRIT